MKENRNSKNYTNTNDPDTNNTNSSDIIQEIRKYQMKDQKYDGKGVFWDGEKVSFEDDPMDDKDIVGDRFGVYKTDEIVTDDWKVNAKISDDIEDFEQDNDHLYYVGKNWKMEIKKIDYNERKQYYSEDTQSLDISEESLPENFEDRYENASIYLNLTQVNSKMLAGYVYLLRDYFDHEYEVSYHGTGFLEDIFLNASCMGGSFDILFDVDAWAEEHKPSGK